MVDALCDGLIINGIFEPSIYPLSQVLRSSTQTIYFPLLGKSLLMSRLLLEWINAPGARYWNEVGIIVEVEAFFLALVRVQA